MDIIFCILIFITGALSVYTDTFEKKIKNIHLLLIASSALLVYSIFLSLKMIDWKPELILNPLIALIMGYIFYSAKLWRAGDAKLFFTYSLLLPVNKSPEILPFSCLALFANTFLASFIYILPYFIKNIITHKNKLIKEVISKEAFRYLMKILLLTIVMIGTIMPALSLFSLQNKVFLNFIILYGIYLSVFRFIDKIRIKFLAIVVLLIALFQRYILLTNNLAPIYLIGMLKFTLPYTLIFYILGLAIKWKDSASGRIPFAPFMFIGAILSNTDLLNRIIKIMVCAWIKT